jgi:hypothetical protein
MRLIQEADDTIVPNDTSWRLLMRTALTAASLSSSSMGTPQSLLSLISSSTDNNNIVERIWRQAISYHHQKQQKKPKKTVMNASFRIPTPAWQPSIESFHILLSSYIPQPAVSSTNNNTNNHRNLDVSNEDKSSPVVMLINRHSKVIQLYNDVLMGHNEEMGMDRIDINGLLENPKTMSLILKSILVLESLLSNYKDKQIMPSSYTVHELRTMANSIAKLECFQTVYSSFDTDRRFRSNSVVSKNTVVPSSSSSSTSSGLNRRNGGSFQINTPNNTNTIGSIQSLWSTQSALKKALSWSEQ